jgi:DNA-directed RNA polymerase subunit RPC12/RpoP
MSSTEKAISPDVFIKFLEHKNCKIDDDRTNLRIYKCPNCLYKIAVRPNEDLILRVEIRSILKRLKIGIGTFEKWLSEFESQQEEE